MIILYLKEKGLDVDLIKEVSPAYCEDKPRFRRWQAKIKAPPMTRASSSRGRNANSGIAMQGTV